MNPTIKSTVNEKTGRNEIGILILSRRLLLVCLVVFMFGCQSTPPARLLAEAPATPAGPQVLAPGDEIEVRFAYAPDFNETQTVRPDGMIAMQLIGEIEAKGKTPESFRKELIQAYSSQLAHPELVVILRASYDRRVFVGGAVRNPGYIEMPAAMSVVDAILEAGGFNMEEAEPRSVIIVRQEGEQLNGYVVDVQKALEEGGEAALLSLKPRDAVFVPRTKVVKVNQWMAQYLWNNLPPFAFTSGFRLD